MTEVKVNIRSVFCKKKYILNVSVCHIIGLGYKCSLLAHVHIVHLGPSPTAIIKLLYSCTSCTICKAQVNILYFTPFFFF